MTLKREKLKGNIIRDILSIAFTSVRSGILILSWEVLLCRRAFLEYTFLSRLERGSLSFLFWTPELSNTMEEELWVSHTLVVISFPPTSLWISKVVSKMFPWESTWAQQTGAQLKNEAAVTNDTCAASVEPPPSRRLTDYGLQNQVSCPKVKSLLSSRLAVILMSWQLLLPTQKHTEKHL